MQTSACLCQCLCVISGLCLCCMCRAQFRWGAALFVGCCVFCALTPCCLCSVNSAFDALRVLCCACATCLFAGALRCWSGLFGRGGLHCRCAMYMLCASCCVLHPTHRTHSALNPSYTQTAEHHRAGGDAAGSQHRPICTAHGTHTYTHHVSYITQHTSHKDKTNNKYMRPALPTHSTQG